MSSSNPYIIEGGLAGKKRLNVLAEVLEDSTSRLLKQAGIREGMRFLDLGCGGGHVSRMAAKLLGDSGSVTAVDFDAEIVALAQQDAEDEGLKNISFQSGSAYDVDYNGVFDVAYSRFLLSHLNEPEKVIRNMRRAVKPGGKVVIEDIDFSGHYCYPKCTAFDKYVELFVKAAANNGQNANIGLSLYSMCRQEGLLQVEYDVVQPSFAMSQGKWMAWLTLDRISGTLKSQGLATEEEVAGMLSELEAFTNDPHTIISLPRIFRVWGQAPGLGD